MHIRWKSYKNVLQNKSIFVTFQKAFSNIQGHRTLSLRQSIRAYQALASNKQSATDGLKIQKRNSPYVGVLRTKDRKLA